MGGKENELSEMTLRNAAGLFFMSVIILLEGNFRTATMVTATSQATSFPTAALMAGGVTQMVMGFAGIFLAAAFVVGIKVSPHAVLVVLGIETVIGWFIFLLFVFVNPGMDATATAGIPYPWVTRQDFNTFVASGILTSAGYCAVLLGAQFSFTAGLWKLAQGQNAQDGRFFRSRGMIYSFMVFFTGLWILIGGGISARLLPGPVDVVQPPLFVVWPGIFIATGVLAIVTGLFGFFLGFLPPRVGLTTVLGLLHVLNCLWQVSVMALYQPPVLGFINPSTPLTGLIIAQLVPFYFHYMRCTADGVTGTLQRVDNQHKDGPIELGAGVSL